MRTFQGRMWGFDGPQTADHDAERLRNHLEAFAADSVYLFGRFRDGEGRSLPDLDQSDIRYFDPGNVDPPLQDAAVTYLEKKGACGSLAIYEVAQRRFRGEVGIRFGITYHGTTWNEQLKRRVSKWHIDVVLANGVVSDPSRRRGWKGW